MEVLRAVEGGRQILICPDCQRPMEGGFLLDNNSAAQEAVETVSTTQRSAAALTVVGRRGSGGLRSMRLGSTANHLVRHSTTNVAVVPATGPIHRGGFLWPDTERQLRNTALVIEEPLGGGHVVLFNHNPLFRGWWRAWDKVVLNTIVLGPAF